MHAHAPGQRSNNQRVAPDAVGGSQRVPSGGRRRPSAVPVRPVARGADPVARVLAGASGAAVDTPGEPFERDADRAADRLLGMSEPAARPSRQPSRSGGRGEPLKRSTRAFFEPRLGLDLGDVRLHRGQDAADAARTLDARAFTFGSDIVFGSGEYAPETTKGRRLIAHELAHVVQNANGAAPALRRQRTKDRPAPPAGHDEQAAADTASDVAWPETSQCIDPKMMINSTDAVERALQQCIDPAVAAEGKAHLIAAKLAKDVVLTDYKNRARQLLTFRLEAMRQWIDIVVRAQLLDKSGTTKPDAETSLQKAAEQANDLGRRLFERGALVDAYEALIKDKVPPPGVPVDWLAAQVTVGSTNYITTELSHAHLQAYNKEIPDILPILQTLGMAPSPTEDEVTEEVVKEAKQRDILDLGYSRLELEGRYHWWGKNVTPQEEWYGPKLSEKEILRLGTEWLPKLPDRAAADPVLAADAEQRRSQARMSLDLEPRGPLDPREVDVPSGYNYVALRFVVYRLRDEAAARMFDTQRALDDHLNRFPLLRLHISNWSVFRNQFAGTYRRLINPGDLVAGDVPADIGKLISELEDAKARVAKDDDLLFDDAAINVLGPLLKLYDDVDHEYGKYIAAKFRSTRRWNEMVDQLLAIGSILGFVIGSALSGGLAAPFLIAGATGAVVLAVRAEHRAGYIESLRDAGIADLNAAAVARFSAWFQKALAVVSVISVLLRPLAASVRWVTRAVQTGRTATQTIRLFPLYLPINAVERALVQQWATELEQLASRAVQIVDTNQGTTRWAQIYRGTGPLGGSALARGNAIHYEFYRLIDASRQTFAPAQVALNQGRAFAGLRNAFSPLRPDVRILIPGTANEAVFDLTTVGQAGHALPYANYGWVTSVTELLYQ